MKFEVNIHNPQTFLFTKYSIDDVFMGLRIINDPINFRSISFTLVSVEFRDYCKDLSEINQIKFPKKIIENYLLPFNALNGFLDHVKLWNLLPALNKEDDIFKCWEQGLKTLVWDWKNKFSSLTEQLGMFESHGMLFTEFLLCILSSNIFVLSDAQFLNHILGFFGKVDLWCRDLMSFRINPLQHMMLFLEGLRAFWRWSRTF